MTIDFRHKLRTPDLTRQAVGLKLVTFSSKVFNFSESDMFLRIYGWFKLNFERKFAE